FGILSLVFRPWPFVLGPWSFVLRHFSFVFRLAYRRQLPNNFNEHVSSIVVAVGVRRVVRVRAEISVRSPFLSARISSRRGDHNGGCRRPARQTVQCTKRGIVR